MPQRPVEQGQGLGPGAPLVTGGEGLEELGLGPEALGIPQDPALPVGLVENATQLVVHTRLEGGCKQAVRLLQQRGITHAGGILVEEPDPLEVMPGLQALTQLTRMRTPVVTVVS